MNHRTVKGHRLGQIEAFVKSSGYSTVSRVAAHFEIGIKTAQLNLRQLRAAGRLGVYPNPPKTPSKTERLWGKPGSGALPLTQPSAHPRKVLVEINREGLPVVVRRNANEWPRGEFQRDELTAALHGAPKAPITRSPGLCTSCKQPMDQPHLADCQLTPYLPNMNNPIPADALRVTFQSQEQFKAACAAATQAPALPLTADELVALVRLSGTALSIGSLLEVAQLPGIFDGASGVALAMRLTEDLIKDLNKAFGDRCGRITVSAG